PEPAVVGDVRLRHQVVVVADLGPRVGLRGAVHLGVLAEDVSIADPEACGRAGIGQVLRLVAEHRSGVDDVVRAELGAPGEVDPGHDTGPRPDPHRPLDDDVGPDRGRRVDLGRAVDDRRRVDRHALAPVVLRAIVARRSGLGRDGLATMLARHGASVTRAPALRETGLPESPEAQELARRLAAGDVHTVILLTGVGTRALAAAMAEPWPDFPRLLERATIIARGPKPLAALRELGVGGAHPVPAPHTWREVLGVVDALGAAAGRDVAVQEYGVPNRALLEALGARGARVLAVPVYRWALPEDTTPLRAGAAALVRGDADVAVFTNGAQVEHLFRVADDAGALRAGLGRAC